jgi:hypothetical protein
MRSNIVKPKLFRSKFVRKKVHCTENMCKRLEFVCVCVCVCVFWRKQKKVSCFNSETEKGTFGLDLQGN